MKIGKRIAALMMSALMPVSMAACAEKQTSDLRGVQEKGILVVGITDFAPMDYRNEDGEWVGFDADLAKAFAASIGVQAEFVEIEWNSKIMELNAGTIDCVWNGMTLTDEVIASMDCSDAYCANSQVVVVPAEKSAAIQTAADCAELRFAVEAGSAGKEEAEKLGFSYTEVKDQATALMEVAAGTADAAVIDALMAGAMVGKGTGYAGLASTISLNTDSGELYGVGFRQGSDLVQKLNDFLKKSGRDGTLQRLAETYGIQAALIEQS